MKDRDIPLSVWQGYIKKNYGDEYLLEWDEIGIWGIRLKQKLGFIQPYSIVNKQLVAVMTFRSPRHKSYFLRKLIKNVRYETRIVQNCEYELSIVFNEKDIKKLEFLFKIRKRVKISEEERKLRSERMKKICNVKRGG